MTSHYRNLEGRDLAYVGRSRVGYLTIDRAMWFIVLVALLLSMDGEGK